MERPRGLSRLSVEEGYFRTTFYLNAAAGEALLGSSLPEELKEQYRESEGKKIRGVTLILKKKAAVELYKALLGNKLASR